MAQQGGGGAPITTIVPFNNQKVLPACAASCGPLYDANGACVPPQVAADAGPTAYTQCFCLDRRVAAFSTATSGVCDDACTGDSKGLSSIAGWFRSICSVSDKNGGTTKKTGQSSTTQTGDGASSTAGSRAGADGGGGDWISNHWQWVIMIVVLVVGIAAIWIGACIWRRRYLRKKDRQSSLGQKHSGSASRPSWGPGMEASESGGLPYDNGYDSNRNSHGPMLSGMATGAPVEEKPKEKKRWIVRDRT
ncbi:integral membrane protein [Fusarium austroafricanum]|uniref:Integral membrane protein n=1 Tax=Fusarium austroafricanum TaxID=2364996 RepID=A0A8H4KM56_9HYPO|nr:integral membrane protein [Fusarium austroafricanum]